MKIERLGAAILLAAVLIGLAFGWLEIAPAGAAPLLTGENGVRDSITVTVMAYTGTTQTLWAASGDGQKFANTGDDFILVANGYTDTITLTLVTGGTFNGFEVDDVDVAIGTGVTKLVGPFNTSVFNQRSGTDAGKLYLNWDATVTGTVAPSVTLAVYRVQ